MSDICVIFDLDGTLVDSEVLCNQAFIDLLPDLNETVDALVARYRGQKLSLILADLATRLGHPLTEGFEPRYRRRVADLFDRELQPTPGARAMLEATQYARCVASSGPPAKIHHALAVSGLSAYFNGNVFSAYEVGAWKPDPGLFLHAASTMGFGPEHCIVVEDSDVGIEAAQAAGMQSLRYDAPAGDGGSRSSASFNSMADLPGLLSQFADSVQLRGSGQHCRVPMEGCTLAK